MEVLLVLATGLCCISCFLIGAKVSQEASQGETIHLPDINPVKAIQERRDKKQAEMEQDRLDTIMRNIEGYDGTGHGQEDVPGR